MKMTLIKRTSSSDIRERNKFCANNFFRPCRWICPTGRFYRVPPTIGMHFQHIWNWKRRKDSSNQQGASFPRLRSRDNRAIESSTVLTWLRAVDMRKVLECGERNETTTEDLSAVSRTEPSLNPLCANDLWKCIFGRMSHSHQFSVFVAKTVRPTER